MLLKEKAAQPEITENRQASDSINVLARIRQDEKEYRVQTGGGKALKCAWNGTQERQQNLKIPGKNHNAVAARTTEPMSEHWQRLQNTKPRHTPVYRDDADWFLEKNSAGRFFPKKQSTGNFAGAIMAAY